ncbi:adenosylcobinamide-phosphate synthase CbiB [Defluviitalea raffinosedens]|jgi:adenosylcobinamide-phosphate synthase|uniref:adenosylcobinamide-phosphate synthase CbiB n=1 Tax=Defluviitalea raffinosedens TaxID=1450156 RepID=UPI00195DD5FD|nr:adenosylcobinamide-phosphate synthase CbiB [Defluviitalea raffinosedens]MBM7685709.1 adenosylcobinamide-phosphate synthase [Defluviitalea raffinosedens]MBZ4667466.1 adenosylcobinamide-phosphate synthase [Defluviitaleaceae bacterium]
MKYHALAFFLGFILDMLLGDPYCLPHPVRWIGKGIIALEQRLLKNDGDRNEKRELKNGMILVVIVLATTTTVTALIIIGSYNIHPYFGVMIETLMTYQILAAKSLKVESMKVYISLKEEGLEGARKAVSMIVGRDTESLDEEGIRKAAIETVAENTSDGVIAPMLYTALGGPVLGFFYKAVNTMDSMIGYKNDQYLYFGRAAAKLDDLVNYIPARISAYLMILAAFFGGKNFNGKQAYKIYKRDRRNHASPNSAQTESVCAGALGIQLAGDASYFGKLVKKPYIGDKLRQVEHEDIKRANHLMYMTAWICEILCLLVMFIVIWLLEGK